MNATIIDGRKEAALLRERLRPGIETFLREAGRAPGLAVVLVGNDPASEIYVQTKARHARSVGMTSFEYRLEYSSGEDEVLALVDRLNNDPMIDGILVQLPLPSHLSKARILQRINPQKDVDGFHPVNAGLLAVDEPGIVPCTPKGCLHLVRRVCPDVTGCDVVVIGSSTVVGRPAAQLFLNARCSVAVTHIDTHDVPAYTRNADIVVSATGVPGLVKASWIKPGAIVIDVGITRIHGADGKGRIVGDVDFDEVRKTAGAITPVPGGVGPMTVAMLLENTWACALARHGGGAANVPADSPDQ